MARSPRRSFLLGAAVLAVVSVIGSLALAHGHRSHIFRIDPPDVYMPYFNVYSQVVVSDGNGDLVSVAGTVSLDIDRNLVGEGDMEAQVRQTFENVRRSLAAVGARPSDVVRINIFTLDVDRYLQEGAPQQDAFFQNGKPASTLVGVTRLADPRYLVEIQVDAVLPPGRRGR